MGNAWNRAFSFLLSSGYLYGTIDLMKKASPKNFVFFEDAFVLLTDKGYVIRCRSIIHDLCSIFSFICSDNQNVARCIACDMLGNTTD